MGGHELGQNRYGQCSDPFMTHLFFQWVPTPA